MFVLKLSGIQKWLQILESDFGKYFTKFNIYFGKFQKPESQNFLGPGLAKP